MGMIGQGGRGEVSEGVTRQDTKASQEGEDPGMEKKENNVLEARSDHRPKARNSRCECVHWIGLLVGSEI